MQAPSAFRKRQGGVTRKLPAGRKGRPTADRVVQIETAILAAALDVFLEYGFEAATMECVAERAEISKGTLYARYQDKEQLFRAVLTDRLERWSAASGASDHLLPSDLEGRLRAHARNLLRMFEWTEYRQINRLVQASVVAMPDIAEFWREFANDRFVNFLAKDMASVCGPNGERTDWKFLAELFLYTFSGWFWGRGNPSPAGAKTVEEFIDQLTQAVLVLAQE
jgi:TetR/AcrR family transcriptional regulator, mexJK operon transcriptional repressor